MLSFTVTMAVIYSDKSTLLTIDSLWQVHRYDWYCVCI